MAEQKKVDPLKVMTGEFRASFVAVFTPKKADEPGKKDKYGMTMLFPKGYDLAREKAAVKACLEEKFGKDQGKWPKNLRMPWRDQAEKADQYDGFEPGAPFINVTSVNKPGLVDGDRNDIIEPSQFYSGCYARATIRAFYYENKGNKGVSFGLQNVQKFRDGEPLGGGAAAAADDFAPAEGASTGQSADALFG